MYHCRKKHLRSNVKPTEKNTGKKTFVKTPPKYGKDPRFQRIPRLPGDRASRPRKGSFQPHPLAELDDGARSFIRDTEGCWVKSVWRGRAAAGGRVALCRGGVPRVLFNASTVTTLFVCSLVYLNGICMCMPKRNQ